MNWGGERGTYEDEDDAASKESSGHHRSPITNTGERRPSEPEESDDQHWSTDACHFEATLRGDGIRRILLHVALITGVEVGKDLGMSDGCEKMVRTGEGSGDARLSIQQHHRRRGGGTSIQMRQSSYGVRP